MWAFSTSMARTPGRMLAKAESWDSWTRSKIRLWAGDTSPKSTVRVMTSVQATYGRLSPTLSYGLGLVIIRDPRLSGKPLIGHQGFAYGCADGAFLEEGTGRQIVFLNGGCSEARRGRLGLCNRDVLAFGLKQLR